MINWTGIANRPKICVHKRSNEENKNDTDTHTHGIGALVPALFELLQLTALCLVRFSTSFPRHHNLCICLLYLVQRLVLYGAREWKWMTNDRMRFRYLYTAYVLCSCVYMITLKLNMCEVLEVIKKNKYTSLTTSHEEADNHHKQWKWPMQSMTRNLLYLLNIYVLRINTNSIRLAVNNSSWLTICYW